MAGGISVHAVDVARGCPADSMRVEIWRLAPDRKLLADGRLGANGVLQTEVSEGRGVTAGEYEVLFHIGEYHAVSSGGGTKFLTIAPFRFLIEKVEEHFHLPLKFTPWGYSLFRGA